MAGHAAHRRWHPAGRWSAFVTSLRGLVRLFDGLLRRACGVVEFCDDRQCLLRVQLACCPRPLRLSDGTEVRRGESALMLHLWNEHIPPMGPAGPDLLWAAGVRWRLIRSLRHVAALVATDPQLAKVQAVGGVTVLFPPDDEGSPARLMRRLGFDVMPRPLGRLGRFGEFWENLYAWALMWAFNAPSLRRKQLLRLQRTEVWMSRRRLLERYGHCQDHRDGNR
ncbi:MAG: hypothetical protein ACETWR_13530 [Anaerolineae bacterium]